MCYEKGRSFCIETLMVKVHKILQSTAESRQNQRFWAVMTKSSPFCHLWVMTGHGQAVIPLPGFVQHHERKDSRLVIALKL